MELEVVLFRLLETSIMSLSDPFESNEEHFMTKSLSLSQPNDNKQISTLEELLRVSAIIFLISLLKCSSSCGSGMQIRSIECVDVHGAHNTQCDPATRPVSVQSCSTGISCTSEVPTTESEDSDFASENPNEGNLGETFPDDVTEEENDDDGERKSSKATSKSRSDDVDDETEEEDDELDMQGDDPRERTRNVPLAYQYRIPRAERRVDPNSPNEPT